MSERADAVALVAELCERIERALADTPHAAAAREIRERATGPLRVAIAGRVKAGKSTMLNALVGERLAATDAGECTRVVTIYRHGGAYDVTGVGLDARQRPLRMIQVDGAWAIDLQGTPPGEFERIEVQWPSSVLHELTLVDTPGLGSLDGATSRRSLDFLVQHEDASGADAVIYLMRHLHALDAEFLEAFMDRSVVGASPVNSIAVLARPDEVGACRPDAMESARRIAERMAGEPRVRALVGAVVPVAGLLAETAQTLREAEVAALKALAGLPADELALMLRSVDDLCDVSRSDLTVETRRALLSRLGLFGVRTAIAELQAGRAHTAGELARTLLDISGLSELRELIRERFLPRARTLKARSAMVALDALARELAAQHPALVEGLRLEIERAEAESSELAALSAAHLVTADVVRTSPGERAEVEAVLLAPGGPVAAARGASESELLGAIERWRLRASDPRAGQLAVQVCETMARVYEHALEPADG
jgi:hypothetical protein